MKFKTGLEADIVVFDAYGTLFDVHSAVLHAGRVLGERAQPLSELWRQKQLEYTWVRTLMGRYQSFWSLTEQALDFALQTLAPDHLSLRPTLLAAYRHLDAYSDAKSTLFHLRQEGVKTAILSNGDGMMLDDAVAAAGLTALFDGLLSIEEISRYKTAAEAYQLVEAAFAIPPARTLFISSNRWDIAGARLAGFHPYWINRTGRADEYHDCPPDLIVERLSDIL